MLPWGVIVCVPLLHKCVLIWSVYLSIFGCIYHVHLINLRLQYEGTLKYLGESVTGSEFGLWKIQQGSCIAEKDSRWRYWHRCRKILAIPWCMCSAFPA